MENDVLDAKRFTRVADILPPESTDEIGEIGVPAGQVLTVVQGQTVRMTVSFKYRGKAVNVTLRCSIGTRVAGIFYESVYGTKTISLPTASDWITRTEYADISTAGCSPSAGYDVEAKISEYASATLVKIDNIIDVIGAPEFQNFAIDSYDVV
jgi:hypothetical protein